MGSAVKRNSIGLSRRYSAALRKQLARKPGATSKPAEGLGSQALSAGLDRLDLLRIHEQALIALPPSGSSSRPKRAAGFLAQALTPIERARRTALRSNGDLAEAHRKLTREIARRESVQQALNQSERHYRKLLDKSHRMQEHLRRLSHELLSAQEEERKRISRELHDEIGQILTAVNVRLATLKKEATVNTTGLKKKIASTQRLLEKSLKTVHRFARALRPSLLDDLGLIPALHSYLRGFTKQTHVPVHFKAFAGVEKLSSDKRTVLYRVAQEALTNVAKHARAGLVTVDIERARGVMRMKVHDNGKSFQVERVLFAKKMKRLGLLGMRERVEMVGGSFAVESGPGKGTTISVQIPVR
jgi:two-component system, NarL family, sensor histidine kinase DegS